MFLPRQSVPIQRREILSAGAVVLGEITIRLCNGLAKPLTVAVAAGCQTLRGGFTVQGGCGADPPCKADHIGGNHG